MSQQRQLMESFPQQSLQQPLGKAAALAWREWPTLNTTCRGSYCQAERMHARVKTNPLGGVYALQHLMDTEKPSADVNMLTPAYGTQVSPHLVS